MEKPFRVKNLFSDANSTKTLIRSNDGVIDLSKGSAFEIIPDSAQNYNISIINADTDSATSEIVLRVHGYSNDSREWNIGSLNINYDSSLFTQDVYYGVNFNYAEMTYTNYGNTLVSSVFGPLYLNEPYSFSSLNDSIEDKINYIGGETYLTGASQFYPLSNKIRNNRMYALTNNNVSTNYDDSNRFGVIEIISDNAYSKYVNGIIDYATNNFIDSSVYNGYPKYKLGCFEFDNTGTHLYVGYFDSAIGGTNGTVVHYNLSTPYELSTVSLDSVPTFTLNGIACPVGMQLNPDGTKCYIGDYATGNIHQFDISVPYDLTTMTEDSSNTIIAANPNWNDSDGITSFEWNKNGNILTASIGKPSITIFNGVNNYYISDFGFINYELSNHNRARYVWPSNIKWGHVINAPYDPANGGSYVIKLRTYDQGQNWILSNIEEM